MQNKWKVRLQLTKPVTWPPLVWGVVCGAAASGTSLSITNVETSTSILILLVQLILISFSNSCLILVFRYNLLYQFWTSESNPGNSIRYAERLGSFAFAPCFIFLVSFLSSISSRGYLILLPQFLVSFSPLMNFLFLLKIVRSRKRISCKRMVFWSFENNLLIFIVFKFFKKQ